MVSRHPRPRFHSAEVLPGFVVWLENLAGNWLQLPRFFVDELLAPGPGGFWLQADGCCSKASWVVVETSAMGNIALARGLRRRCTLHFKYDGGSTLYMRVFGEDGRRAGCCPEANDDEEVLSLGDGRDEDEGEPALGSDRVSSRYGGSSSRGRSSNGGYDQSARRRARFKGGSGSSRRRASVKR